MKGKLLGERLIEKGLITEEQLSEALRIQAQTGEMLGRILINYGMISLDDLLAVLEIDEMTSVKEIDERLLKLIPEQMIRKYRAFPIKKVGSRLYVAMTDPGNVLALDDLRLISGYDIEPVRVSEKEISAYIDRYLGIPEVQQAIQEWSHEEQDRDSAEAEEEILVDDAPVIRLVNTIITKAIDKEASDIHIEPFSSFVRVRFRVDGLLYEAMSIPRKMVYAIISRIKILGGMDIAERRKPQDGRVPFKLNGRVLDLRISTMPTVYGEKVVIRILDKENIKNFALENLGFSSHNLNIFKSFLRNNFGMVLVVGPTGSGKTTTLYAALNDLNSIEKNIITIEDPVEYALEGINQTQVNARVGTTFATYLRSILRQDPDIIMIGEIRDLETAEIAVRAATTGHLVLSTLHTNDAPGTVTRLIDMGVEPFMVASSLLGVVAQRLVRKICPNCRTRYEPDEMEMSFAGLTGKSALYTGKGCSECNFTGYKGRVPVHEVLAFNNSLQRLILKNVDIEELRQEALRAGMVTLKEDGIQKALQGVTTLKEVMRVAYRGDVIGEN